MFEGSAEFYDLIYSAFKDYRGEAIRVADRLRRLHPACRTILDAACGTGEHARLLGAAGFDVDGLDLDPALLRIARQKHPGGRFFEADMGGFRLPHRYDAVTCLFSSIGYLQTLDRVERALSCFREHLAPGGVVVVEPWFGPGALEHGRVMQHVGESEGVRVTRSSRLEIEERISRLHFDYEIVDAHGSRHASETHVLGLFTTSELLEAFRRAGLDAVFDAQGLNDRGLYWARLAA